MNKGDETPHGTYLGEVVVAREVRLKRDELEALPQVYTDQAPRDDNGQPVIDKWADLALGYKFDDDGQEVVVLAEDL